MKRFIAGSLLFLLLCALVGAEERILDINSSEYTVRIHTSNHEVPGAKKTALLLKKDGVISPADAFYITLENDFETFALMLHLLKSYPRIRVRYESTKTSPWGDPKVLAITTLESIY